MAGEVSAAVHTYYAKNIAAAHDALKNWSDALTGKLDSDHNSEGELYNLHCPMAFGNKGDTWLHNSEDLIIPYYGAMMLKCGMIQKQYL